VTQRNKILVRVHSREDNFRTSLGVDPNSLVKDVYPLLSAKIKKFNEKFYEFRLYKSDIEVYLRKKMTDFFRENTTPRIYLMPTSL
jgi:hypothetical protein